MKSKQLPGRKGSFFSGKVMWQGKVALLVHAISLAVFLYLLILIFTMPFYFKTLEASPAGFERGASHPVSELKSADEYRKILDAHPLFGSGIQAAGPATSACDELLSKYSLSGIIQGGEPEALFKNKRGGETTFARAGEDLDGFAVVEIKEHSVVVICGGMEKEMMMEEA